MKHVVTDADAKFIDSFTNLDDLMKYGEAGKLIRDHVAETRKMKQMQEEIGTLGKHFKSTGWSANRTMQRVASIPGPILGAILQVDPDFLKKEEKFFRWLNLHPEYDVRGKVA